MPDTMDGFAASFVFGITGSLHCAGMCGPLGACFAGRWPSAVAYHTARVTGYAAAGMVAGVVGGAFSSSAWSERSAWISLCLGAGLVWVALSGSRLALPGVGALLRWAGRRRAMSGGLSGAAFLGGLTPLLPCGLLYAVYPAALVAGTWDGGATILVGFALGSLPGLACAQVQLSLLRHKLGPTGWQRLQRAAMLLAAGVLLWRGWASLGGTPGCCG